jgi:hypothetical protein
MRRSSCTSATCGRCAASISRAERARWLFAADRPQSLESQRGTARCCEEQEFSPLAAVTAFDDVLSGVPLHVTHLRGSSAVPVRASKFVSVRDLSSNRHQSHQRRLRTDLGIKYSPVLAGFRGYLLSDLTTQGGTWPRIRAGSLVQAFGRRLDRKSNELSPPSRTGPVVASL